MTVGDAAKYLFVSRSHIHALLASGQLLEVLPGNPFGEVEIEVASAQAYRAKLDAARQTWLDTHTEDNDPVGS
jgi:excisionase family DNA binding protein